MASIFDYELGDEAVPGYKVVSDLGGSHYYRLLKVQGPDKGHVLWKRIDLTAAGSMIETRLLGLLTKLDHPGLTKITNLYKINGGKGLLIQTAFPLMTLKERLSECIKPLAARGVPVRGQGIPADEVLRYMEQMADAVDFLNTPQHEYKGEKMAIVHRALRPDCMLLFDTSAGRLCKISDFGLAKAAMGLEAMQHSLGWSQQEFSPPEFADGQTAASSDQFSLAAVYYHLRTNELPYTGTLLQQMQSQMNDNPSLDLVPQAERDVIRRALFRDPSRRFADCREFVKELLSVVPHSYTTAAVTSTAGGSQQSGGVGSAAAAPARSAAVFYRRGTGLSQMDIELPPCAPGTSSGSATNFPALNLPAAQTRKPNTPTGTPKGIQLTAPPPPRSPEPSVRTPPSPIRVPDPPARTPETPAIAADISSRATPPSPTPTRIPPQPAAIVPPIQPRTGERPKVYMPRSRAEVVLPPVSPPIVPQPSPVVPRPLMAPQQQSAPAATPPRVPQQPARPANPPVARFAQQAPAPAGTPQYSRPAPPPPMAPPPAAPAAAQARSNHAQGWQAQPPAVVGGPVPPWSSATPPTQLPWGNTPVQTQSPWTTPSPAVSQPPGTAAPSAAPARRRSTVWMWVQLVLLIAAALFLGYTFLIK
jgi:serine/threonine-protein kinase